jgi:hypothetical protein
MGVGTDVIAVGRAVGCAVTPVADAGDAFAVVGGVGVTASRADWGTISGKHT